jgi:acyl-coenzyme A thioesterase PaaI-like protein
VSTDTTVPAGFEPYANAGAFLDHVGPLYVRGADGVLGVRVEDRHLNAGGSAMGGFLATVVDAALGRAIRAAADDDDDDEPAVATVSLTTDFLRPGPAGAWIEARTSVEQLGGNLAFADCSLRAGHDEIVRARAVFAVRS